MKKDMICIVCPRGCHLHAEGADDQWVITGNMCPRGIDYAQSEMMHPMRMLTSTVRVIASQYTRLSVQTSAPIPKELLRKAMDELNGIAVNVPIHRGDIIKSHLLGLEVDLIATRSIDR